MKAINPIKAATTLAILAGTSVGRYLLQRA
jgi:hypothetical protein